MFRSESFSFIKGNALRNVDDFEKNEKTVKILLSVVLEFLFEQFLQSNVGKDEADINQTSFPTLFGTELKILKYSFNNHNDEIFLCLRVNLIFGNNPKSFRAITW